MKHYPILAWPGGKRRLAKKLIPMITNRPHTCYVEEFAGGGSMFFLRDPASVEVLNDLNGELINLYRVVKHHLEEFLRQFKNAESGIMPGNPKCDMNRVPEACDMRVRQGAWYCQYACPHRQEIRMEG